MLVQVRETELVCIAQHDHGIASGVLAHAWSRKPAPFSLRFLLACSLHDAPWRGVDDEPVWNPDTGRPHDFISHPLDHRIEFYREGLSESSRIHPYAGLLGSLHYVSFAGMRDVEAFTEPEAERRKRLRRRVSVTDDELQADLRAVQFFDLLSLFICLTPPPAKTDELPAWLAPGRVGATPWDLDLDLQWVDENHLGIAPFPLREPTTLTLPVRVLDQTTCPDAEALQKAWDEAREETWTVALE